MFGRCRQLRRQPGHERHECPGGCGCGHRACPKRRPRGQRRSSDIAAFRDRFTRSFVSSSTNADGEALVSNGNTATFGVTAFIGMDIDGDTLDAKAGDWIYAERGGNYIIAKIAGVNDEAGADFADSGSTTAPPKFIQPCAMTSLALARA